MTCKQQSALGWLLLYRKDGNGFKTAGDCPSSPNVMGSLVRKGWADSVVQEERPLHQGTIRYGWYRITAEGIAALNGSDK